MKHIKEIIRQLWGIPQLQWEVSLMFQRQTKKIVSEQRKYQLWEHILHDSELGITDLRYADSEIIVSLTSYGRRLQDVAFAIESIMEQTMKANRIILWLAHEDYLHIPQSLLLLKKKGLEIEECDDLLSYKKIIPALRKYPRDVIITIDDDAFYDCDVLEHLIRAYQESPQFIHCCRAHKMVFADDGFPKPYAEWHHNVSSPGTDILNFATGVGGVLYPPGCLDKEVFNEEVFMDICKYADDIWLKAMALKKGTLVNKVSTRNPVGDDYVLNEDVQSSGLYFVNVEGEKKNDRQLKEVLSRYSLCNLGMV